jgi:hypothetical protein
MCTVIEMEAGFYWASDASYLYIYISLCVSVNGAYLHNYSTSDNIFHKGFDKLMVYEEVSIKTQNAYCKEGK